MKCANCGAEIKGRYCEYCGSENAEHSKITVNTQNKNDHYLGAYKNKGAKIELDLYGSDNEGYF